MKLFYMLAVLYAALTVSAWGFHQHGPEYNAWDTKELQQWLKDHKIKYTSTQSRDDLLGLIRKNWNAVMSSPGPFVSWDEEKLINFLNDKGVQIDEKRKDNRDWLVSAVQKNWKEAEDHIEDSYSNMKDWIFDTWSESALNRFIENHSGSSKKSLLENAKDKYDKLSAAMQSTGQDAGDWIFDAWSDSDLSEWLVIHGYKVPRKHTRKDLILLIKKYSYELNQKAEQTSKQAQIALKHMNDDIKDAHGNIRDSAFDSWSESDLKAWCDAHGIKVPQKSKKDELIALTRRHKYLLRQDLDSIADESNSIYNSVADKLISGKETAQSYGMKGFEKVSEMWPENRLKEFLHTRGINVPVDISRDRLRKLVWEHRNDPVVNYWTFESWSLPDLQNWFKEQGKSISGTRDQLATKASQYYDAMKSEGGDKYQTATSKLKSLFQSGKDLAFDTWSDSDLKSYLDSYGVKVYQGSTRNELIALARRHTQYFRHGAADDSWYGTFERAKNTIMSAASGGRKITDRIQQHVFKPFRHEL
ncbi:hypothetical protein V1511DRAFT_337917 [Dipodascopsis uninucleata]